LKPTTPLRAVLWAGLLVSLGALAQAPTPRPRTVAPPPAAPSLPPASDEQKEVATRVHTGEIPCDMGQTIRVRGHATAVGYIDVAFARQIYVMRPVQSQTGAIRLEDIRGDTLMLQLGNKSMLMNVKVGQRLADGCVHPVQREAALAAERAAAEAKSRGEAPAGLFSPAAPPAVGAASPSALGGGTPTLPLPAAPAAPAGMPQASVPSQPSPQPSMPATSTASVAPLNLPTPR
jgi:hypothetical protein